jgi:hypothetical protein
MNDAFVKRMTTELPYALSSVGKAKFYLGQAIAFEQSRFMNDGERGEDPRSMRLWAVRLIYLSILYHQHKPAIPEAKAFYDGYGNLETCQKEREDRGIGRYDYECPGAKFIVVSLSDNGLGANIRSLATTALLAGLISDRIVLFVNKAPLKQGTQFEWLKEDWGLASCDRRDSQCFFLPTSPCTIINKDLEEAFFVKGPHFRQLFKKGTIPHGHEDDKVWVMMLNLNPQLRRLKQIDDRLHSYAKTLIDQVPETDPRLPVMKAGLAHLMDEDPKAAGYNYAAANLKVHHALNFYAMRPNLEYSAKIDQILDEIIPVNFDAENAFGLPIRGKF